MIPEERAESAWAAFTDDMGNIRSFECAVRFIAAQIRAAELDAVKRTREECAVIAETTLYHEIPAAIRNLKETP